MVNVRLFETEELLASKTLDLLRKTLQTPGNLMLSGGSTPYALYNQLAASPCPAHPFRRLFLSDERMVPLDSPKSNAGNLMPMLHALKCVDRFIRVETNLPAAEAANRFSCELEHLKHIDLGFLGMGSDGHTAGIFTPEQARIKSGVLAIPVERPDGMKGISLTPAIFQRTDRIILLVTGESKRAIIKTLLHAPETIPAGIALADHPNAELWTDINLKYGSGRPNTEN